MSFSVGLRCCLFRGIRKDLRESTEMTRKYVDKRLLNASAADVRAVLKETVEAAPALQSIGPNACFFQRYDGLLATGTKQAPEENDGSGKVNREVGPKED